MEGSCDSPTWSRGKVSFSMMVTARSGLYFLMMEAAVEPAGPPPMMATSVCRFLVVIIVVCSVALACVVVLGVRPDRRIGGPSLVNVGLGGARASGEVRYSAWERVGRGWRVWSGVGVFRNGEIVVCWR